MLLDEDLHQLNREQLIEEIKSLRNIVTVAVMNYVGTIQNSGICCLTKPIQKLKFPIGPTL